METIIAIAGEPATFATSAEAAWREIVIAGATGRIPADATGLSIAFDLSSATRNGHYFDLDNLCEPVFSGLTRAGWFHGKRPNIRWWQASKRVALPAGVEITPSSVANPPEIVGSAFKATFSGMLPKGGSDLAFPEWVRTNMGNLDFSDTEHRLGVALRFGSGSVNIGDIATGAVKRIIDCLYPLIGGAASKPHDWKVHVLFVEKGCDDVESGAVEVSVWSLPSGV